MEITMHEWPILVISGQFKAQNDEGYRLRQLVDQLEEAQGCRVIPSFTYEDGYEIFRSRADFGCIVIDWDIPDEDASETSTATQLIARMRQRHARIPLVLLTGRLKMDQLPTDIYAAVTDCLWKTSETISFLAGRIHSHAEEYVQSVYPPFFGAMVQYCHEYKFAWHTPGHMGGEGFLRSPAGAAMFKFFGENVFRADLSVSVPELGSLLEHSDVVGDAERNSARVFGADRTYYVLNGTSNVNQIIWRSQLVRDDIAFVDRNCHKSLNYAMVITEAYPIYMIPRRNKRGIIGPVRLAEFSSDSIQNKIRDNNLIPEKLKAKRVKMSALTNSTYDGICYNVINIKKQLEKSVENLHFDEAWYAYARFHDMYRNHYGMADDPLDENHPPIFCSQSTHKLLTAFSQASMLHIKQGGRVKIDHDQFNESYMMHGSTSPQYTMIASLDVATRMMDDNGATMMNDIIKAAVRLRQKVINIGHEYRQKNQDDWFFSMWQPRQVSIDGRMTPFETADVDYLAGHQAPWVMDRNNHWHGFDDIEDDYAMLDPIKLTFTTPGIDDQGQMQAEGIPASVVTNFLIDNGIVCEKTDYYSFLLLNSLGATEAKQGTLISALLKFKTLYDADAPLAQIFPKLVAAYPHAYQNSGLKTHCNAIHRYWKEHHILDQMQAAFQVIPTPAMKPADAYHEVVRKNVEFVELDQMMGRTPAVMLVPYPPGIPILMGGEMLNQNAQPIFDYLKLRQDFENEFPGYESEIHGVERIARDGQKFFKSLCLKK